MMSGVQQLQEALSERESTVAESLNALMAAEEKFKEKMKDVVQKLKEESDEYIKTLGDLKKMQERPVKRPKKQIDLNMEDTSDLADLFGLRRLDQLKGALAPVVLSVFQPYYDEQFLPESQRTSKYVPNLHIPLFERTAKKVVIACIREFAASGHDLPTDLGEWANNWRNKIEAKVAEECHILRAKAR